jgi:drug/metabolite transporter (DMT)-like permease
MAFADVPQERMSRASSLSSMGQQLAQAIGVGIAAITLHLTLQFSGSSALTAAKVSPAFVVIGLMTLLSLLFFRTLPTDAAAEVSGNVRARSNTRTPPLHRNDEQ